VYQAGTLSGNPVAMAAGLATLKEIRHPGFYDALEEKGAYLERGLRTAAQEAGVAAQISRVGSMLGFFFSDRAVENFEDAKSCDLDRFSAFYRAMLRRGIYLAPSQFEALFLSAAHNVDHIDETITAAAESLKEIAGQAGKGQPPAGPV
jgi:glutamate-1-semialdehyde 2,1-aminomutase